MAKAFIFPGQGSQRVGMGKDIYESDDSLKTFFHTIDEVSGLDVRGAMFEGPEDTLKQTQITQPALYTHSLAVYQLISQKGLKADIFAGHSLGEFSALAAAGVFSVEDGMRLVSKRGALMAQAKEGSMAAIIGLADDVVISICDEIEEVWPANFNAPAQVVVSGSPKGISQAIKMATEQGAKRALPLQVSGAFHTPFMQKAAEEFKAFLERFEFKRPRGKVIPNVTAEPTDDPGEIKEMLARQLLSPVLWTKTMQTLGALGVNELYELGSGNVLCGLAKRGMKDATCISVGTIQEIGALPV
jgi:[acyl-carrier-protein] S-malonyltransferase